MKAEKRRRSVFRPKEKGLRKIFGDLEAEIMDVIWGLGRATVADVHKVLEGQREIAYTTVKTVMGRLAEKGYLRRTSADRAHLYTPTKRREQFLREVSDEILTGLFVDFGEPIAAHLLETVTRLDPSSLDRLQALIEERRARERQQGEGS
ncbi:MAG: BlaI/MecI/CopY family transcriptional regulator [Candidatus Methylomirabilales bacterium]